MDYKLYYASHEVADKITKDGRKYLKKVIKAFNKAGIPVNTTNTDK